MIIYFQIPSFYQNVLPDHVEEQKQNCSRINWILEKLHQAKFQQNIVFLTKQRRYSCVAVQIKFWMMNSACRLGRPAQILSFIIMTGKISRTNLFNINNRQSYLDLLLTYSVNSFTKTDNRFQRIVRLLKISQHLRFQIHLFKISLREKCPNTELFLGRISPYSVRMRENTDQK